MNIPVSPVNADQVGWLRDKLRGSGGSSVDVGVWMWEKCKRLSTGDVAPDASWLWNVASKCEAVTRS